MRRNMLLIRLILEGVEALPADPKRGFSPFSIEGFPDEALRYHARLCEQAGLVVMGRTPHIRELTWTGHELLDKLRADQP